MERKRLAEGQRRDVIDVRRRIVRLALNSTRRLSFGRLSRATALGNGKLDVIIAALVSLVLDYLHVHVSVVQLARHRLDNANDDVRQAWPLAVVMQDERAVLGALSAPKARRLLELING